jgi:hypothetical protein
VGGGMAAGIPFFRVFRPRLHLLETPTVTKKKKKKKKTPAQAGTISKIDSVYIFYKFFKTILKNLPSLPPLKYDLDQLFIFLN